MKFYRFNALLQKDGWMNPSYVGIDDVGIITYLSEAAPGEDVTFETIDGFALPGFQNAHSHAFQYAMAGMAEKHRVGTQDDFWTWREAMYTCALNMDPDQLEAVATMLYAELLRNGYTHVAEFHYLHHDKAGHHFENSAEMGERLIAAASNAGIKITLVPVFYQKGNFGTDPYPQQRRFISRTTDEYFQLLDASANTIRNYNDAKLGFGIHSLRAVETSAALTTFQQGPQSLPFHLHAAEQLKEVEDCEGFLKKRPVEWLIENLPLDNRFHIIHCTHLNDREVSLLAATGANVVLCPGTEGNLGDGIFRLADFATAGGSWSIGTDSHISLNPLEDLRWLDYSQRLTSHKRNTFDDGASMLFTKTLMSGRKAMSREAVDNFFSIGKPLDAVVFDANAPLLAGQNFDYLLPCIIYTADPSAILGTLVNGKWIIKRGQHAERDGILNRFTRAIRSLGR